MSTLRQRVSDLEVSLNNDKEKDKRYNEEMSQLQSKLDEAVSAKTVRVMACTLLKIRLL